MKPLHKIAHRLRALFHKGKLDREMAEEMRLHEPTGNRDSKNGDAVMELLHDLHRSGATIVMVTHDQRFARHAERTVHLFDGRVVAEPVEAR